MKILLLNIIIIVLLLVPIVYGTAMVISVLGYTKAKRRYYVFVLLCGDKFLTQYDLYKWLYRNK